MANTSPHQAAKDYITLVDEYDGLRDKMAIAQLRGEVCEMKDYDRLLELYKIISELNTKYYTSIHYIVPDREFTQH